MTGYTTAQVADSLYRAENSTFKDFLAEDVKTLAWALRRERKTVKELEAHIESHEEEFEQTCGYKKLIDTRGKIKELEDMQSFWQNENAHLKDWIKEIEHRCAEKDELLVSAIRQGRFDHRCQGCGEKEWSEHLDFCFIKKALCSDRPSILKQLEAAEKLCGEALAVVHGYKSWEDLNLAIVNYEKSKEVA